MKPVETETVRAAEKLSDLQVAPAEFDSAAFAGNLQAFFDDLAEGDTMDGNIDSTERASDGDT